MLSVNNNRNSTFTILDILHEKGDGLVNEDTYGISSNHLWVIDGVTDKTKTKFFSTVSDAEFFSKSFSQKLLDVTKYDITIENSKALVEAMEKLYKKVGKKEFSQEEKLYQPSFTIAMVSFIGNEMCIDILSDCFVYLYTKRHTIRKFTDERINRISQKTQKVRDYIIQNNIPKEKAKELLYHQKMENRLLMNQENGYWVGTIDGVAFNNMFSHTEKLNQVEQLLICSDGFNKAFEYNDTLITDVFSHNKSLQDIFDDMRYKEMQFPKIDAKMCDDATAILIRL